MAAAGAAATTLGVTPMVDLACGAVARRVRKLSRVDLQGNLAGVGAARSANPVAAVTLGCGRSTRAPDGLSEQQWRAAVYVSSTTSAKSNRQDLPNLLHLRLEV